NDLRGLVPKRMDMDVSYTTTLLVGAFYRRNNRVRCGLLDWTAVACNDNALKHSSLRVERFQCEPNRATDCNICHCQEHERREHDVLNHCVKADSLANGGVVFLSG